MLMTVIVLRTVVDRLACKKMPFDFTPAHKSHELFQGRNVEKLITPFTADSGFDLGPPHLNPSKTPIQASFGRDGSPSRPLSQHKTGLGPLGERALPTPRTGLGLLGERAYHIASSHCVMGGSPQFTLGAFV